MIFSQYYIHDIFSYDIIDGFDILDTNQLERVFDDFNPEHSGTIIINPPYGERLDEESNLESLYQLMGDVLKQNCPNSNVFLLSGNPNLAKHIGLQPKNKIVLKNGKIDCRLLHFPILDGKYVD